jgi:hypothetical protein
MLLTRGRAATAAILALLLAAHDMAWASPPTQVQVGAKVRITTDRWAEEVSPDGDQPEPESRFVGKVLEIDSSTIAIRSKSSDAPVVIPRSAILRLEVSQGSTRLRNTLIGAGIGTAVSLALAAASNSGCEGGLCGIQYAAYPLLGLPIGAVVGLLSGGERWVDASEPRVELSLTPSRGGVHVAVSLTF